jgi:hypothetical protein
VTTRSSRSLFEIGYSRYKLFFFPKLEIEALDLGFGFRFSAPKHLVESALDRINHIVDFASFTRDHLAAPSFRNWKTQHALLNVIKINLHPNGLLFILGRGIGFMFRFVTE